MDVEAMVEKALENLESNKSELSVLYASGMIEIIHNGSLMVDDLEDKSLKRRGDLCTYLKFGEDVAVNSGTLMYFAPMIKLNNFVK